MSLGAVLSRLIQVDTVAKQTLATLLDAQGKIDTAVGAIGASSERLEQTRAAAVSAGIATATAAQDASRAVDDAATNAERRLGAMETRATTARDRVAATADDLDRRVEELEAGTATKLDDLLFRLEGYDNAWTGLIREGIAQMQEGILSGEDFISKFGDFTITLGDKVLTIREMLDGMDLGHYEDQVQHLIDYLEKETLSVDEILERLRGSTSQYSQELAKALELFRRGGLTLEELARHAERLREVLGKDSQGGALAEELLEAIRKGLI